MTQKTSDEEYVRRLIEAHLRTSHPNAQCDLVEDDPPDILCRVGSERWAIEVTRAAQREVYGGIETARLERDQPILKFGVGLGNETKQTRRLKYLLILNGPPLGVGWSSWKRKTRKAVTEFIASGARGSGSFPGGSITATDSGKDWIVAAGLRDDAYAPSGRPSSDIAANIGDMLRYALDRKTYKLGSLTGYDRIALALINTYFFGDDAKEVAEVIGPIISADSRYSVFDHVYYVTPAGLAAVYDKPRDPAQLRSIGVGTE
jgi:hypothetical protein